MAVACFHTLSITQFLGLAEELHGRVSQVHGRIEITRDGCEDVCILISKAELDALERALEILAQTSGFQEMHETLNSIAMDSAPAAMATAI